MTGEVCLKGENVCLGYAKNIKDLSKKDINKKNYLQAILPLKTRMVFFILLEEKKEL